MVLITSGVSYKEYLLNRLIWLETMGQNATKLRGFLGQFLLRKYVIWREGGIFLERTTIEIYLCKYIIFIGVLVDLVDMCKSI